MRSSWDRCVPDTGRERGGESVGRRRQWVNNWFEVGEREGDFFYYHIRASGGARGVVEKLDSLEHAKTERTPELRHPAWLLLFNKLRFSVCWYVQGKRRICSLGLEGLVLSFLGIGGRKFESLDQRTNVVDDSRIDRNGFNSREIWPVALKLRLRYLDLGVLGPEGCVSIVALTTCFKAYGGHQRNQLIIQAIGLLRRSLSCPVFISLAFSSLVLSFALLNKLLVACSICPPGHIVCRASVCCLPGGVLSPAGAICCATNAGPLGKYCWSPLRRCNPLPPLSYLAEQQP